MNVKNLIEQLQRMPEDAIVKFGSTDVIKVLRIIERDSNGNLERPPYVQLRGGSEINFDKINDIPDELWQALYVDDTNHKIEKPLGKYATMIRKVFADYPAGLGYMDIVELLYTKEIGSWTKAQRKQARGWGGSNLCDDRYNLGILKTWFFKSDGKWIPNYFIEDEVISADFKPFKKVKRN